MKPDRFLADQKQHTKTVKSYTLGCKTNFYESEAMIELFRKSGYIIEYGDIADIYIINTCAVTVEAERKSRRIISGCKKQNPAAIVIVSGCYCQLNAQQIRNKIPGVDILIGTVNRNEIVEITEKFMINRKQIVAIKDTNFANKFEELPYAWIHRRSRAVVKIQDGCDNFCAYCIIPYARGRAKSRKFENIVSEVEHLAKLGFWEIVLTGTNISSYRDSQNTLIDVVEKINNIKGIRNIRLSSIEPTVVNEVFIQKAKHIKKLCAHFHLSLQSGCDQILKLMNRKYTTEQYRQAVSIIRQNISNVSITTDIIVGFPSETSQQFLTTLNFVREIQFMKIHAFCYSPRPGTVAANMPEQVSIDEKKRRTELIIKLSHQLTKNFYCNYIDKIVQIMPQQAISGDLCYGLTSNYMSVYAEGEFANVPLKVHIDKFDKNALWGHIVHTYESSSAL